MTLREFHNALRILRSIDGHELPDLHPQQVEAFIADPYAYFIRAEDAVAERIWAAVQKRQPEGFKVPPTTVADVCRALETAVSIAGEAQREWDAAPSGMRAGKILIALAGGIPGYRADTDAIHQALKLAKEHGL